MKVIILDPIGIVLETHCVKCYIEDIERGDLMLEIGDKAIDFTLQDKNGKEVSLSDYRGQKVILYFYPKDNTPGCTKQACSFRDHFEDFKEKGVVVIGVSKDSVKSHENFAKKHDLPFILLSDPTKEVIQKYGVYKEKKNFGRTMMGVERTSFLIDQFGVIQDIIRGKQMHAATNAQDILEKDFVEQKI